MESVPFQFDEVVQLDLALLGGGLEGHVGGGHVVGEGEEADTDTVGIEAEEFRQRQREEEDTHDEY